MPSELTAKKGACIFPGRRGLLVAVLLCGFLCALTAAAAEPAEKAGEGLPPADKKTSEIRLYGRGDFDITYSRKKEGSAVLTADLWKGSRAGVKAHGELGGGFAALLHLESGFGTKDGRFVLMQDKVFGRQAYVGLESGLGTVTFGRQYPVSDAVVGLVDLALPGILSPNKSQFYWQIDRLENAVIYASPTVGGFKAGAGYAFGGRSGAAGSSTATAGLIYGKGRLNAGVSLESWKTSAFGQSSAYYNFWNLAASYDLGAAELSAGFSSDDVNMDLSSNAVVPSRTYALGATIPTGSAGNVVALCQLVEPEVGSPLLIATLRYNHSLSKRTDLYWQVNVANHAAAAAYGVRSEVFVGARYRFDHRVWGR